MNHKDFIHSLFTNAGILESQDAGSPCHFEVTPDLQNIVVAYGNAKYGLYRINLAEYFSHNPGHVFPVETLRTKPRAQHLDSRKGVHRLDKDEDELDFSRGTTPVSEKGTPSNRSWWNYLDALKHKLSSDDGKGAKMSSGVVLTTSATDNWQKWYLVATGQLSMINQRPVSAGSRDRTPKGQITGFQNKKSSSSNTNRAGTPGSAKDRSPRIETSAEECLSTAVRVAKVFRGLPVKGVSATNTSALLWYGGFPQGHDKDKHGGLCFLDLVDNTVQFHR